MKTLEEKEKEFKKYVAKYIVKSLSLPYPHRYAWEVSNEIRTLAHALVCDFKEEIEGFNMAMSDELDKTKEELDKYKDAFNVYYKAVHDE